MLELITTYYEYNSWATEKLLTSLEQLSEDEWNVPLASGNGSIRETMAHLLQVQKSWFSWFDGSMTPAASLGMRIDPSEVDSMEKLRAKWREIDQDTRKCVDSQSDDSLKEIWRWELPNGFKGALPLWTMMHHVANHGTHTRAQVVSMIRRLGHTPENVDMIRYCFENMQKLSGQN